MKGFYLRRPQQEENNWDNIICLIIKLKDAGKDETLVFLLLLLKVLILKSLRSILWEK